MIITFPDNTNVIDAIRNAIGRYVTINVQASGIACSSCGLDPITNLSTDPFCSECSGNYWLYTTSAYLVLAHITHIDTDQPVWTTGGTLLQGGTRIQIKYTDENYDSVLNAVNYVVDGKTYLKKELSLRGSPAINRIVITLEEQEG